MRIGLLDVDGKNFPNIPLMKISAYHKAQGDQVEWYMPFSERYDIVYMSKVFSFTQDYPFCVNADKIVKGGSGYAISLKNGREYFDKLKDVPLDENIEHIYPDYALYNITDTAYGFMSRGCPRGCSFCHVKEKEGLRSEKVADLREFWNGQKKIVLCDPNLLACRDWKNILTQLADSKAWVDINQGLDARLMTEDKSIALSKLKMKEVHFAWDRYQDKEMVLSGIKLFLKYNRISSHNVMVYTLVNYDTTFEQDLERIYTLREMGCWAYIMVYDVEHADKKYKQMRRWVNNRFIFAKCYTFEDYINPK